MDNRQGRPQLKKIKRPINRTAPQASSQNNFAANPFNQNTAEPSPDAALDSYLDEPLVSAPRQETARADGAKFASQQVSTRTQPSSQPQYLEEDEYEEEVYGYKPAPAMPEWLTTKVLVLISCLCLFIGIVAGKFIFAEAKIVRNGLQGVVVNNEVPRGRARCGVAERTQGCVLYLMNPQRQDMRAKDFYDLAAQMTGRQRFMIETGNMRYANSKIRPGDIAQLNIPPL